MTWVRWRPRRVLSAVVLSVALAGCSSGRSREEREAIINVYPNNYRTDLLAALHTYVSDPTNIRDAYVSEPAIRPVGLQNRYAACVRFNARNSDGRYVGSRDVLAVFTTGRFDQFVDASAGPANPSSQASAIKELCSQAEYQRFPELEALRR
ncbi:MAG TPA: hypothetical protein VKP67_24950 [Xanthobacteraceae bacterium]|nr:hypothetical protein [Xanthobacteraceae bacterium]